MEKILSEKAQVLSKSAQWLSLNDLSELLNVSTETLKNDLSFEYNLRAVPGYLPNELVRDVLLSKKYKYPKKIISFQMLKGGVAKTTSALNIGLRASMLGARVLFVDLDQQANLTFALGALKENQAVWLDIFEKKVSIHSAIKKISDFIDLIPSSLNNSVLERSLVNSNRNWSDSIKTQLGLVKENYDLIIIDTAPALSATNTAVSVASDLVILPVNPDKFSILGFEKNYEELLDIKKDFSLKIKIRALFTRYDSREKMSSDYLSAFIDKYPDILMKNYVRTSSEAKNTLATQRSIFSSRSTAKEDYHLVTLELMDLNCEELCHQ